MGALDLLEYLRATGFALALTTDGGIKVSPASALAEDVRQAIRAHRQSLLALLDAEEEATQGAQSEVQEPDPPGLAARFERLVMFGWDEAQARALAERLNSAASMGDDRVACAADCLHYRPGHCANHRRAGLTDPVVGSDLASLPQRCPGFLAVR